MQVKKVHTVRAQRRTFDHVARKLQINRQEDWYSVTGKQVKKEVPALLSDYKESLYTALQTVYPEFEWNPLAFTKVPREIGRIADNHRELLDRLGLELGVEKQEDWYLHTEESIARVGGEPLVSKYGTLINLLTAVYPEYQWNPFLCSKVPRYYLEKEHHRQLFDWIAEVEEVESQEDWYGVDLDKNQNAILSHYGRSLYQALRSVYPEFEWDLFRFKDDPHFAYFCNKIKNHQKVFDHLSQLYGIRTQEDWYQVKPQDVFRDTRGSLMEHYNGDLFTALQHVYPQFEWDESMFQMNREKPKDEREQLDYFANELKIQQQEDWYDITAEELLKFSGGNSLLRNFGGSLFKTLNALYPEFKWEAFKFPKTPRSHWMEKRNCREFFDWLAEQLEIETQEDWYLFDGEDLKMSSQTLFNMYNGSLIRGLSTVYPEYDWSYWNQRSNIRNFFDRLAEQLNIRFQQEWYALAASDVIEHGGYELLKTQTATNPHIHLLAIAYPEFMWFSLSDVENQKLFFSVIAEQLNITSTEQWINVPKEVFLSIGGRLAQQLLWNYGSWIKTLQGVFPEHPFDAEQRSSLGQNSLVRELKRLIGEEHSIVVNHKLLPKIELDVFIPSLQLAFEYQGGQHYTPLFGHSEDVYLKQKERDVNKREICKSRGITLIEVGYWWQDINVSSLISTIQSVRPDIPLNTSGFQHDSLSIQGTETKGTDLVLFELVDD